MRSQNNFFAIRSATLILVVTHFLLPLVCGVKIPIISDISSAVKNVSLPNPFDKGEQCYDDIGCFKRFPPSNFLIGLVDFASGGIYPASPESVDVQFLIYTCADRYRPHVIEWNATDTEIRAAPLDTSLLTIFLVHGFTDNYDEMNWMGDMKDFIMNVQTRVDLREGACEHNVIGVDWSGGSKTIRYSQATANTQMVGAVIARFIRQLIRLYPVLTPNNFSIVGHSLGSHVAGFAGSHFPAKSNSNNGNSSTSSSGSFEDGTEQLRLIIGLDPAGPAFSDIADSHRLDPTDARLVLSIHTNGGSVVGDNLGIEQPLGHYAFYPNGGFQQPGCEKTRAISNVLLTGIPSGISETVGCSHRRAQWLVQVNESQLTTAHSMGYQCESHEAFQQGKCAGCTDSTEQQDCKPFGNWFTWWQRQKPHPGWREPIAYFLDTGDHIPYTLYHYRIAIRTTQTVKPFKGYIKLTLIGDLRDLDQIKIEPGTIKPNETYYYLAKTPKDMGAIRRALGRVNRDKLTRLVTGSLGKAGVPVDDDVVDPTQVIDYVDITFMSHEKASVRQKRSSRLRPTNEKLVYRIKKIGNIFEQV